MNHHRTVFLTVTSGIFQFKTLRKVIVHLDCTQLPLSPDCILDHKVKFRTVERSLTVLYHGVETFLPCSIDNGGLGLCPVLVSPDIFFLVFRVTKRHLCDVFIEIQCLEYIENNVNHLAELFLELIRTAEKMGIVLSEGAHPGQTVQFSALLVTVNGTELCKP